MNMTDVYELRKVIVIKTRAEVHTTALYRDGDSTLLWYQLPAGACFIDPIGRTCVKLPDGTMWHAQMKGNKRKHKQDGALPKITITPTIQTRTKVYDIQEGFMEEYDAS